MRLLFSLGDFSIRAGKELTKPIDAKILASNFAVEVFSAAAFSMSITNNVPIEDYLKVTLVSHMVSFFKPNLLMLVPIIIPYGTEILEYLGISAFSNAGKFSQVRL